ncbi:hypothetical protein F2Q69_00022489 [Brassica cretica]|uniref:Uncharacterized protein n=1 Tax=Brassica cretica TaxID=69181 RepID=A0A8S9Q7H7_BRACR|nr:hypothetical protein F2Q69_00022489 [Brassica cretica]
MANALVFLSDLQNGRSSSIVQVRLLRFYGNGGPGDDMPGVKTLPTKISVGVDGNVRVIFAETTTGGPSGKKLSAYDVFHSS